MPSVVTIEKRNVLPFRLPDPRIPGRAQTPMLARYQAKSRVIAHMRLNYIDRIIHRAVIDYQILKITKCLPQYRVDGLTDIFGDVIGGRHDRDKR